MSKASVLKLDDDRTRFWRQEDGLLRASVCIGTGKWRTLAVFAPNTPVDSMFRHCQQLSLCVAELRATNASQARHITDLTATLVQHGLWPT